MMIDPKFTVKEFMLHPKSLGVHDFLQQQLIKLEKGFQKKPIVAFTNSTVFILDFYIYD